MNTLPFHSRVAEFTNAGAQLVLSVVCRATSWVGLAARSSGTAIAFALAAGLAALSSEAHAIEFKLKKGGQFELCRDMAANLKAFPDLLPQPFDMPFDPALTNFRTIEWESLDPLEHVSKLRQYVIYRHDRHRKKTAEEREADWQREKPALLEMARAGEIALEHAYFDANHDGKREPVYRFGRYRWPATYDPRGWVYAWNIFVLPEDDPKAVNQWSLYSKHPLNPFYYKGRIFYFNPGSLIVYEPNILFEGRSLSLLDICYLSLPSK